MSPPAGTNHSGSHDPNATDAGGTRDGITRLSARVSTLLREAGSLARDHAELAVLDARRAGIGLTKVLVAAVVISVLAITAWLSFVAGFIVWITDRGLDWPAALAIGGLVNLALAVVAALWMRSQKDSLTFEATLRQIRQTAADARELS